MSDGGEEEPTPQKSLLHLSPIALLSERSSRALWLSSSSCLWEGAARLGCGILETEIWCCQLFSWAVHNPTFVSGKFCCTQSICVRVWLSKREKKYSKERRKQSSVGLIGKVQPSHIPLRWVVHFPACCSVASEIKSFKSVVKWERQSQAGKTENNSQPFVYDFV